MQVNDLVRFLRGNDTNVAICGLCIDLINTASALPVENFLFSAGGGFLFGAVAEYAIKKVMKIAAVIVGLFVTGLAYLSYRG